MKKTMCVLLTMCSFHFAQARDSSWHLCKGDAELFGRPGKIALNVFEHRSGADSRATELTLIYGSHILQGTADTTDSDTVNVVLKNKRSTFLGSFSVSYEEGKVTLKGDLNVGGGLSTPVKSILTCEEFGS